METSAEWFDSERGLFGGVSANGEVAHSGYCGFVLEFLWK